MSDFDFFNERLRYEPETGKLLWRVNVSPRARAGAEAGTVGAEGYRVVQVARRSHQAHRLCWMLVNGSWPIGEIDHINGVRNDNRIANLRDVTKAENMQNKRVAQRNNKSSGLLGVSWDKGRSRWQANIGVDGRQRKLGYFVDQHAAHAAYMTAKRAQHISQEIVA